MRISLGSRWPIAMAFAVAIGLATSPAVATPAPLVSAGMNCVASAGQVVLAITVKNVHSSKGDVTITIYPGNPKRFLAPHAKLVRTRIPAAPVVHACMDVPYAGDYAVAVYHDENGDHNFNRTFIGLPAEGYGFSNDAPAIAGLPTYNAAKFAAHKGVTPLTIKMRY